MFPFKLHFRESPKDLPLDIATLFQENPVEFCLDMPHSRESLIIVLLLIWVHAPFRGQLYTCRVIFSFQCMSIQLNNAPSAERFSGASNSGRLAICRILLTWYCFIPERALPMSSFLTFQSGPFMLHFRESPIELHLEMLHFRGNLCMELCLDIPHSRENLIVTMFINMPHASFIPGRELYTVYCVLFSFQKKIPVHTHSGKHYIALPVHTPLQGPL